MIKCVLSLCSSLQFPRCTQEEATAALVPAATQGGFATAKDCLAKGADIDVRDVTVGAINLTIAFACVPYFLTL